MYAALTKEGTLINAQEAKKDQKYYCCQCAKQVKLISTESRVYFRHKNEVDNETNERIIHMKGKGLIISEIAKFCPDRLETEVYLAKIQQRPDVLINRQIAIEYQCAKINIKTFEERVQGYRQQNIHDIWILGGNYLDVRIRREHLKFISYNENLGYYLLMLDSEHRRFTIFHQIKFVGPFNKIIFQEQVFEQRDFDKIFNFHPPVRKLQSLPMNTYLLNQIRRKNDVESQRVKMNFYNKYHLPVEAHLSDKVFKPLNPIYKYPAWQMVCGQAATLLNQPLLIDWTKKSLT